jgi:hypothetical protein
MGAIAEVFGLLNLGSSSTDDREPMNAAGFWQYNQGRFRAALHLYKLFYYKMQLD